MNNLNDYREYSVPEVALRCVDTTLRINQKAITSKTELPDNIVDFLSHATVEHMMSLQLGNDLRLINYSVIAKGTLTNTLFSVAEIARTAILSNCNSIMLLHNHSSMGKADNAINPEPSALDKQVAIKTYTALHLLGIQLVDFIIVGPNKTIYSFREHDIEPYKTAYDYDNLTYV